MKNIKIFEVEMFDKKYSVTPDNHIEFWKELSNDAWEWAQKNIDPTGRTYNDLELFKTPTHSLFIYIEPKLWYDKEKHEVVVKDGYHLIIHPSFKRYKTWGKYCCLKDNEVDEKFLVKEKDGIKSFYQVRPYESRIRIRYGKINDAGEITESKWAHHGRDMEEYFTLLKEKEMSGYVDETDNYRDQLLGLEDYCVDGTPWTKIHKQKKESAKKKKKKKK